MRLKDKVVLITGGGGDIGSAIAKTLAREEAIVAVNDIDFVKAETVAEKIKKEQGRSMAIQADVSKRDEVDDMFDIIENRFKRLDILVNNAGISIRSSLKFHMDEDWEKVIHVNLYSVFYCSRSALKLMIKQKWGRIINISSMLSFYGDPFGISYAASKGAINSFTKSLAREAGRHGITVNAICPGLIDTEMSENYMRSAGRNARVLKEMWTHLRPIKRDLEPQDVANLALFLASEESSFVNGQLHHLDGGMW
ncbi:MAG: SDR family NAD(P)-dependent oxidoreductase [Promethearchaeota archaeon]|jgi:3-oxoacyl-[acyl-carrier protein] reductase